MLKLRATALLLTAATLAPLSAQAAQASSTLAVSATVLNSCVVLPAILAFGNVSSAANTDATASISVTCTLGTSYNVGLDAGAGASATVTARKMTSAATDTLNYALYRDSNRTLNWGVTVGTNTVAGSGNGLLQTLTVYGRVPSGQTTTPAGAYTDTVNITVEY